MVVNTEEINMYYMYAFTALALIVSFASNRRKTLKALKIALKKFLKILPAFLTMLILISIVLFLIPDQLITEYLGHENLSVALLFATLFGSITIMPGFIAFPLSGILLGKGVPYMVISAFTTTLMIVGVLSYPVEKAYFGTKVTIMRNTISFCIALVVALVTGLFFGEVL